MTIETISEHACFGGTLGFYRHTSTVNNCSMQFSVYQPPQAKTEPVPVITYLAGLTCTEETFMIKSGAQRYAAQLGLMLVSPDTSPRGDDVPDDPDGAYDFGIAAGLETEAMQTPVAMPHAATGDLLGTRMTVTGRHDAGGLGLLERSSSRQLGQVLMAFLSFSTCRPRR